MTHFTDPEIRLWSESGPGADGDRVIAHLAACARCAALYAEAVRTHAPAGIGPAGHPAEDVDDFVATGYGVPSRHGSIATFPARRRRTLVWLAAAAALIAAIAIPVALRFRQPPPGELTLRGGGIQALAPVGSVSEGATFAWSTSVSPSAFRLDIGDANGVVYSERTSHARVELPAGAWRKLSPGVDYWWTVTALDRDGQPIAASERQAFRTRPR